jgi:hypothetical protein
LLTPKGQVSRRELKRKFEGYKPLEQQSIEAIRVDSPIPEEKTKILTDDAWLRAMRHYDDETSWDKPREEPLKGGVIELSRTFEKVVESEPERFAKFSSRFDERISSRYFSALLSGLAKSNISSDVVFAVCETFFQKRPYDTIIQTSICDAIENRVKDNVPKTLIELARNIALTSADPDHEAWRTKASDGQYYYGGDPHSEGINTTRGRAVRVYVRCMLEASPLDTESLLNTLEKVATDNSSAVRACLIEALPYLLRFDSNRVVSIFEIAVDNRPELLECRVSDNFIYYALRQHGSEMLKHISALRHSEKDEAQETCGRLATLVYFDLPKTKSLYRKCLRGDTALRRGVAKVLARNVDQLQLLKRCLTGLRKLYNDSNEGVRQEVGEVFQYLPSPTPLIKRFIAGFLCSQSVVDAAKSLVDYAERIQMEYPEIALLIAEQTQLTLGKNLVDIQKATSLLDNNLVSLAVAIQTHNTDPILKVRALDLFERVMDLGSHYATEALKTVDR